MEEKTKIEIVTDNVKDYLNTRYELVVLKAAEKTSTVGSELISFFMIILVSIMAFIFLSISLAWFISESIGNPQSGFFIVGGFYLVIVAISVVFRKQLMAKPFRNIIIKSIFNED
ncbi:MAG: phage holin family protein [Bacteroidota bacterium]|nr:phage holin family protein [Bacteroidota bacterium]